MRSIFLKYLLFKGSPRPIRMAFLITFLGIVIASAILVVALSVASGFETAYKRSILDFNADIVVMNEAQEIYNYKELLEDLAQFEGVKGVSPFIYRESMVLYKGKIKGLAVKGIDYQAVKKISNMVMRRFEEKKTLGVVPEVLLGKPIAEKFGISSPQEVNFLVGENRFAKAIIAGTFESGLYDYDSQFALTSLPEISFLFNAPQQAVTGVEIKTFDPESAKALSEVIRGELPGTFQVTSWDELNRPIFEAVKLEKIMFAIIVGLLVLVGMFNIISALILKMLYKIKDIAILSAIGMKPWRLRGIFTLQGGLVGGSATVLGCTLGVGMVQLIKNYKLVHIEPEIYFLSSLPANIEPDIILLIVLIGATVSFLVSYLAAGKVVSLKVAEGLKEL